MRRRGIGRSGGVYSGVLFSEATPQPFGNWFAPVGPLVSRGGVAVRLGFLVAGGSRFGLFEFGFAFGLCEFVLVAKDGRRKEAASPFPEDDAGPAVLVSVQASVDLGESRGAFLVREQDPARDEDDECSCCIDWDGGVSMEWLGGPGLNCYILDGPRSSSGLHPLRRNVAPTQAKRLRCA